MQKIEVLPVDVLLHQLRNDLITWILCDEDNVKVNGPIVTLNNSLGKHVFIQQKNGEWSVISKYTGKQTEQPVNMFHGLAVSSFAGDLREKFFLNLIKKLFKNNKFEFAELNSKFYLGDNMLTYHGQSGSIEVKKISTSKYYNVNVFDMLTKPEVFAQILD